MEASARSKKREREKKKKLDSCGINALQTSRNKPAVCTNTSVNRPASTCLVVPTKRIGLNMMANLLLPLKVRRDPKVKLKNFFK